MNLDVEYSRNMQRDFLRGNFTDRQGAAELKARIEDYWRKRGFDVQVVMVEAPFSTAMRSARFDIRSDLVNGWPRTPAKSNESGPEPSRN